MKAKEAIEAIEQSKLKNLIILYGEERYFVKEVMAKIEGSIATPEFNITYFENKPEIKDLLNAMETFPFMSEKRLVVIKNTEILSSTGSAEYLEPLNKFKIPQTTILLIQASKEPDKRKALVKKASKEGMLIDCCAIVGADIVNMAIALAKKRNLILSRANAQLICDISDGEMNIVANEVEKLSSICVGEISKKEIEFYAVKSQIYNIFQINDFLLAKKYKEAKAVLDKLLEEDPNPMGFLVMLSNNFKQMLVARACRDAKFSYDKTVEHIIKTTGAKNYPAKKAVENCKFFTLPKIREGLSKFAKMDFDAKQGIIDLKTNLFALLADIYN